MVSLDPSITIITGGLKGGSGSPLYHRFAIEWNSRINCFSAVFDYVREESGEIKKIDGRPSGVAWRNVKLHGAVQDYKTQCAYLSESILDRGEYDLFAEIVIEFLSVYRFTRSRPAVSLIEFDDREKFVYKSIEVEQ
jgi:hypothetical protein